MLPLEAELGRVFDGHDPLVRVDEGRQHAQQRGLSTAGSPCNEQVGPGHHTGSEEGGRLDRQGPIADEILDRVGNRREFTDGDQRPVDRHRRKRDAQPGAIGKTGFDQGALRVDPLPGRARQRLDDSHQVVLVGEGAIGDQHLAVDLDIDRIRPVDGDLGDPAVEEETANRQDVLGRYGDGIRLLQERGLDDGYQFR